MQNGQFAVSEIYDALFDDEKFASLPQLLASTFGARSAFIHWSYRDGGAEVLAHSGYFSEQQMDSYANEFAPLDPWLSAAAVMQSANMAVNLEQLVSSAEYERSAFYNEYVRAMGDDTYRCMGVRAASRWGSGMVAVQRGKCQDTFEVGAVERLNDCAVHLRRMLALRGRLSALERQARCLQTMVDGLGGAAFLVRPDATLIHANAAAEALLAEADCLCLEQGRLAGFGKLNRRNLAAAFSEAGASKPAAGALLLQRAQGSPFVGFAYPAAAPDGSRLAMLLIKDPEGGNPAALRALKSVYQLTEAEADIGMRLARGASVSEIAQQRGVSASTVRAQLKTVGSKMGCGRQAQIVAAILPLCSL